MFQKHTEVSARQTLSRPGWPVTPQPRGLSGNVSPSWGDTLHPTPAVVLSLLSRLLLSSPCTLFLSGRGASLLLGSLHQKGGRLPRAHQSLAERVPVQGRACSTLFSKVCSRLGLWA